SFGGEANSELSVGCTDPTQLEAAYQSVVDRYSVSTIDLDIEGAAASTPEVDARRAAAIAALQAARQAAGRPLSVWLTLPVGTSGLTDVGRAVLNSLLGAQVTLTGVNALTMDYGQALPAGATMATMAESALSALHQQVSDAYSAAGRPIDANTAWQHIGATPMIGQNDTTAERFELSDAQELVNFARSHHLALLSMWSLNRDQSCGPNYPNVEIVSDACSGVSESPGAFTNTFAAFSTSASTASGQSSPSASSATTIDNPETSPYQIWNPSQAYPVNTKVVWHHNVYESKWYTQGDTPDAPVAAPTDTPWTLIGPVLPGEHPAPIPTLAAGTYPAWAPAQIYIGGDRVMYHGVGYQAKWWTQGDVPGAPAQTPSNTPWQTLATP
ncbi:MAG TPA: carbohydrate-binding protein, partial [Jatrophihabitantaceae bacterium]|nr:carbohydrate-binding protein [Jatrophihabitantaceae bacterium]